MITPKEFVAKWKTCNESSRFVLYPQRVTSLFGLPAEDRLFLADAGLPAWAAPHMHFFFGGGDTLLVPHDQYGIAVANAPAGLGMLGGNAEGWPICFDRARPGEVLCLRLEAGLALQFVNASVRQLAACLLAYGQMVEAALAWGGLHGGLRTRSGGASIRRN